MTNILRILWRWQNNILNFSSSDIFAKKPYYLGVHRTVDHQLLLPTIQCSKVAGDSNNSCASLALNLLSCRGLLLLNLCASQSMTYMMTLTPLQVHFIPNLSAASMKTVDQGSSYIWPGFLSDLYAAMLRYISVDVCWDILHIFNDPIDYNLNQLKNIFYDNQMIPALQRK